MIRAEGPSQTIEEPIETIEGIYPIPFYFRDSHRFPEGVNFDQITGLPVETDEVREALVVRFSSAVRRGESWAYLYTDADELKRANERHSYAVGDFHILRTASVVTTAADPSNFTPTVEAVAVRSRDAADEFSLWFFGLMPGDLSYLNRLQNEIEQPFPLNAIDFTCSVSSFLITSTTPNDEFQEALTDTRRWLKRNPFNEATNLFHHVRKLARRETLAKKALKENDRLLGPSDQSGFADFIAAASRTIAGGRMSADTFEYYTQLSSLLGLKEALKQAPGVKEWLMQKGIDPQRLDNIRNPQEVKGLFLNIFNEPSPPFDSHGLPIFSAVQEIN